MISVNAGGTPLVSEAMSCSISWRPCLRVEPSLLVDQHPLALGQDGVVGGVPGHGEGFCDPGDGEVTDHDRLQRPPQSPPGQLRAWLGDLAGVLAPHVLAASAPVAFEGVADA